jgi:putative ABC transport system permease protein
MMWLKRLKKNKSLRIVSLLGLSIVFACTILSYAYIKYEWSYDRFHEKADRIVRFSIRYGDEPADGRIYGFTKDSPVTVGVSDIEDAVLISKIETGVLTCEGKVHVVNSVYLATANFFDIFSYKLTEGVRESALDAPEKAVISKRLAGELFGKSPPLGKEIQIAGRRLNTRTLFISGVFDDFPENTHFHTDLIVHRPDNEESGYTYAYLLLYPYADKERLRHAIATRLDELNRDSQQKVSPLLMSLTDIHLHSRLQRELEVNGNINYIYTIAGANVLLLFVVLFNLWLNARLIFASSRQYYRLLRLNGASPSNVLAGESRLALTLGMASLIVGNLLTYILYPRLNLPPGILSGVEIAIFNLLMVGIVWTVSILPVMHEMSTTLFLNNGKDLRPSHFSLSGVKFMLIAQFSMVMFIIILGFGINRQMHLVKTVQVGGRDRQSILVMKEQPDAVKKRYDVLRAELLKYSEIKAVTSSMQLPGTSVRDGVFVRREGKAENDGRNIPLLVVGDGFLPFFGITPLAGNVFQPSVRTYSEEDQLFIDMIARRSNAYSSLAEEYVINLSAMQQLGFASPDEAIGNMLQIESSGSGVGYIKKGRIVGVTEDFTYTTAYEASTPLILMQRKMFQHCIMVRLSPGYFTQALEIFNRVWAELIPEYPADYIFLKDVYTEIYHSELKAEMLVYIFSLLSLVTANMGLIVIMTFLIRQKTKEIGIRKVNGATSMDIIRLLNSRISLWIAAAFVIAIPLSYWVMTQWLENFAQKISLYWWVFTLAGLSVWIVSLLSISWQSWRAARIDPVQSLKTG